MSFGKRKIPKRLLFEEHQDKKPSALVWLLIATGILLAGMIMSMYANAGKNLDKTFVCAFVDREATDEHGR